MKMKGRIFLLDDDELIITMLSRALRNEGFETQVQTSGRDVIEKIEAWHPDLVMLDIHLGEDRNGLDILNEIKPHPRLGARHQYRVVNRKAIEGYFSTRQQSFEGEIVEKDGW